MIEDLTFLEEGKFTQRDERVKEIARTLKELDVNPIWAISEYVSKMRGYKNWLHKSIPCVGELHKLAVFRKRTASEILKSGYVTGCTDVALSFIVLARELRIPTCYVEALDEEWVNGKLPKCPTQGHVFVDTLVQGIQWRAYEPKGGLIRDNNYVLNGRRYVVVGKGLDFSELFLKENNYRGPPINLQSMSDFGRFRSI